MAEDYRALATEVLELGEQLFKMALVGGQTTPEETNIEGEAIGQDQEATTEDLRVAADEFFAALRLLFGLPQL